MHRLRLRLRHRHQPFTRSRLPRQAAGSRRPDRVPQLSRTLGGDVTFTFDAHLAAEHRMDPAKATGTFRFSHYLHGEGAWAKGRIDCLVTGDFRVLPWQPDFVE
ncbi:hypothetical protein [Streptomyces canus]|uniref:hypothetical protein n=1 Tax=Streptomyces canus TaxID=58343 RepID=UPI0036EBD0DF